MKTAIVTGGARGIGKSIVTMLANRNYNVVINYNNSAKEAEELKQSLISQHKSALIYKADVKNRGEVDDMVSFALQAFGSVDLLVNNAGISDIKLFTDVTQSDWRLMIDTILTGTFNVTQAVLPVFIHKKSGKIINIGSIWGEVGASCEVPYSAAKAGIIGFTKALAKEVSPSGITVNCVSPGIIKTDMLAALSEDELNMLKNDVPLGRLGTAEDVADAVKCLIDCDYITGQVLSVNGGFSA